MDVCLFDIEIMIFFKTGAMNEDDSSSSSDNNPQEQIVQGNDQEKEKVFRIEEHSQLDIDDVIGRLERLRQEKPGKKVDLDEEEIRIIVKAARDIFQSQASLLRIEAPMTVCGDIHGQFSDLLRIFQYGGKIPVTKYLFLGDYVDRGKEGIETICYLFCLKIRYPDQLFLLRGNHETAAISKVYGFYHQVKTRYTPKLWRCFVDCFNCMPIAAIISDKIFCMHGGLSPTLIHPTDIVSIHRPTDVPDQGVICDLLWSDPGPHEGWIHSQRGVSYTFGEDVSTTFLKKNNLDLIVRAHQVVQDGYEFGHHRQVLTIFSAPNYCGQFDNSAGLLLISPNLRCELRVLCPERRNLTAFHMKLPKLLM